VNCGPRSNFLYIAIPFYFYSHCLLFCILLSYYHSIRSILCLQQTGEIDNLIISWEQSSWLCCVQVSRCCWWKATHWQAVIWRPCLECHEASNHHLLKFGFLLLVWFNLGFTTEGRLATLLIIPSFGVSNWSVIYINTAPSGAQDKELVLQVARQGLEKLVRLLTESLILNPESPLTRF
jgi:hypothetical protein